MGHADTDIVGVLHVMPVAWWGGDLLLNLNGDRHFDLNLLERGTLLSDLDLLLNRNVNLDREHYRNWNLDFSEYFDLLRNVDKPINHLLCRHVALNFLVDDLCCHVFFLDKFDSRYLHLNLFSVLSRHHDRHWNFYNGRDFDRNGFNVGLGYLDHFRQ